MRSHICCFDVFGQPGTWQDACCLFPLEQMILMTYDDPDWVHEFLRILQARKKIYIQSMAGAHYDSSNSAVVRRPARSSRRTVRASSWRPTTAN